MRECCHRSMREERHFYSLNQIKVVCKDEA